MNSSPISLKSMPINSSSPQRFDKHKFKTEFLDKLKDNAIDNKTIKDALAFLQKNAFHGSEQARFQLGVLLIDSYPNIALRLFIDAYIFQNATTAPSCDDNEIHLKMRTAILLEGCQRYPRARPWVLDYFEQATAGDSKKARDAKYQLAALLKESDSSKAWSLIKEIADVSHAEAAFDFAQHTLDPTAISPQQNIEKAAHHLKHVGYIGKIFYQLGDYVFTSSEETALYYYQVAAEKGIKLAEFRSLEILGAQVTPRVIVEEPLKPSEKIEVQVKDPAIAYQVAMTYLDNKNKWNIPQDKVKGQEYLLCAAAAGYLPAVLENEMANGDMKAAFNLYLLHDSGNELLQLPVNKEKAKSCLTTAAFGGHLVAADVYAKLYLSPLEQLVAEAFAKQEEEKIAQNIVISEEWKKKAFVSTNMGSVEFSYSSSKKNTLTSHG